MNVKMIWRVLPFLEAGQCQDQETERAGEALLGCILQYVGLHTSLCYQGQD